VLSSRRKSDMTTKPTKPGTEVDSWCTKCRMDLLHRIIAMHNGKIIRVECRTCGGHHNYRAPKSAARSANSSAPRAPGAGKARSSSPSTSPRRNAAAEAERQREEVWGKAVLGQPVTSFKSYRATLDLHARELIRHGKFGDGYIVRVVDRQKVEVMFKDGPRMLAQALE